MAADDGPRGSCPSCGDDAWLDLRQDDVVLALCENESFTLEQTLRGWVVDLGSLTVLGFAGVFLGVMLSQLFLGTGALVPAFLTMIATALAGIAIVRRLFEIGRPPRVRSVPMRWRYALPSPAPPQFDDAPVTSSGERLIAPLSGRSCIGYEVSVRRDDDGRAALGTWLLMEQETAALATPSASIPAGRALLQFDERERFEIASDADQHRVHRFLRERGFAPHGLRVFETIVPPHAVLRARTEGGRVVVQVKPSAALPPDRGGEA